MQPSSTWTPEEWREFEGKLRLLPLDDLAALSGRTGLTFTRPASELTREDYIGALDESDKTELLKAYDEVVSRRGRQNT